MKQIFLNIEIKFERVIEWLCRFNSVGLFAIKTGVMMVVLTIIEFLYPLPELAAVQQYNIATQVLIMVLVFPYLETLFFHNYLLKLGIKYSGLKVISVFLSACIFGIFHNYSGGYIFATTISGLFYGTYYFIFVRKSQDPVLRIYLLHAANNLLSVILNALA